MVIIILLENSNFQCSIWETVRGSNIYRTTKEMLTKQYQLRTKTQSTSFYPIATHTQI